MARMTFGVIGCSRVALKGFLPALSDSYFAGLRMVGSRNSEKAKEIATQFGANSWGTYDEVIRNKDIVAVYISLPNTLHEEWAIKALEAGKHVICEKPAATSYDSAKRMVQAAQKNNVRLLEGLMFRHHPQNAKVKDMIGAGQLGNLLQFDGCFGFAMPNRESSAMKKEMGGGVLHACGVYPIAASRMVFGEEPANVCCRVKVDPETNVDVEAHMSLEYSRGKVAFISSFFGSYYQSTYSVLGTEAHIRLGRAYAVPRDMSTKIFFDTHDQVEEMVIEPADHFRIMLDDFYLEVSKGKAREKDYEGDLLAQARVLQAARMSAAEKRIVSVLEIQ